MVLVLGAPQLYRFTGGRPPDARELRRAQCAVGEGALLARRRVLWRNGEGVTRFVAHVHPGHAASIAVARSLGLVRTDRVHDGEVLWRTPT